METFITALHYSAAMFLLALFLLFSAPVVAGFAACIVLVISDLPTPLLQAGAGLGLICLIAGTILAVTE